MRDEEEEEEEEVPLAALCASLPLVLQLHATASVVAPGAPPLPLVASRRLLAVLEGAQHALEASAAGSAGARPGAPFVAHFAAAWRVALEKVAEAHAVCRARAVRVRRHDNGLFANVLQVLDVLVAAPPGARLDVDWRVHGSELHFRYGEPGTDVWAELFEPLADGPAHGEDDSVASSNRLNLLLCSVYRGGFLASPFAATQRLLYHAAWRRVRVRHAGVLAALAEGRAALAESGARWLVGVHKRVDTPAVRKAQASGEAIPPVDAYIEAARAAGSRRGEGGFAVFLATDDAGAVAPFRAAFGDRLVVRDVRRTDGGVLPSGVMNEVHNAPGCTLREAVDVLVDALLLAECLDVVHADSNVTLAAAIINPDAKMHHVSEFC